MTSTTRPHVKRDLPAAEQTDSAAISQSASGSVIATILLWGIIVLYGGFVTWLCIAKYMAYNVGMLDLGNMSQAIGSVMRGQPLVSSYGMGSMSRLALHVELIYFLVAPLYALWPDPRLLLIVQATLFALGALPVYWIALRHGLSQVVALCLVLIYLCYPTAVTSVLFDFHGDTLAMPLLLFTIDMLDRRSWRGYFVFLVLALSCKVYVALPAALLGVLAWWRYGERRVGLITVVGAVAYGAFAFLVIRPFFVTDMTPADQKGLNYIAFYFGNPEIMLATWRDRVFHGSVVLGPAIMLSVFGLPWLLAALPLVVGAALSTGPGPAYAYYFHHYALAVPFIIMAAITGSAWLAGKPSLEQMSVRRIASGVWAVLTTCAVLYTFRGRVDTPLQGTFWRPSTIQLNELSYGRTARDAMKDQFLARYVPPGVPLAASPYIAAHVPNRAVLYMVHPLNNNPGYSFAAILPAVDYVLTDALFDHLLGGQADNEASAIKYVLHDQNFGLLAARDGIMLFERDVPASKALYQHVETRPLEPDAFATAERRSGSDIGLAEPAIQIPAERRFGPDIGLLDAQIEPQAGRRVRATFEWTLTSPAAPQGRFAAVSRLEGVTAARMLHVPTALLHPVSHWEPGQVIRETFDVDLPDDLPPGKYTWRLGWYDLGHIYGYLTDERSRLPDSEEIAVTTIEIPPPDPE